MLAETDDVRPSRADLREFRACLGLTQKQAAYLAGLAKAQNFAYSENGDGTSSLGLPRWHMMRLRAGAHPKWRLVERSTGFEPVFKIHVHEAQLSFCKLRPTPRDVFEARVTAGCSQSVMCSLALIKHQETWAAYEKGNSNISSERWELLLLKLGQHPLHELVNR